MKKIAGSLLLIFLLLLACDSKECSKDNQLICVSLSEPYIEFYSKNGKKLREFNLSDSPYLKKRLAFAEQQC
ncbi:MAG: hypothetical protein CRN43_19810 [Candidatus Nephrothrix sp. EaCA]|nr:MAG: hypothetical protein CRN43_19810 [Candidatus Nephrothrix sp. EaCA]